MKKYLFIITILVFGECLTFSQSKSELEEKRRKTLEEISYTDKLLSTTAKKKTEGLNDLRILGNKVQLRENVIKNLGDEIKVLNERIDMNRIAIEMMEADLQSLKRDYSKAIVNSYKSGKVNQDFIFILSAKDFNQGYKRLKYLRQVARYRRTEAETIYSLKEQIVRTKEALEEDLSNLTNLKTSEENQKNLLVGEKLKTQKLIKNLSSKEKQLQKELQEKKLIAQKIEREIARIVEEEKRLEAKRGMTPEQKLISDNFAENKGKLPWPVERGIITSKFGIHQHPVLKYVTEENFGIEITCSGKVTARAVFKGTVTAISPISGANMTVIVRHGKYLTVYSNIVNVKVKKGDTVQTKQEIGDVFMEAGSSGNCVLKFMIFEEKYLDPELWIAKN